MSGKTHLNFPQNVKASYTNEKETRNKIRIYKHETIIYKTRRKERTEVVTFKKDGKTAVGGCISVATLLAPHRAIPMKKTAPRRSAECAWLFLLG